MIDMNTHFSCDALLSTLLMGLSFGPEIRVDTMIEPASGLIDMVYSDAGLICVVWDGGSPTHQVLSAVSMDGGITWNYEVPISDSPSSSPFRPGVAADSSGRLFVAWEDHRGPEVASIYFSRSLDLGSTWLIPNLRISDPGVFAAGADIACSPDGEDVVVVFNKADEQRIYSTCSFDGGLTWSDDVPVGDNGTGSQFYASVCWAGDDRFVCCWLDARSPEETELYCSTSFDGGASWLHPNIPIPSGGNPPSPYSIKLCWAQPFLHAFWIEEYWTTNDPFKEAYYSRTSDGGITWLPSPARVDSGGSSIVRSWGGVWSADSRSVYTVWKQVAGGTGELLVLCSASADSGQTWGVPVIANGESRQAFRCAIAGCAADSDLFVCWNNNSNKEIWFARGHDMTGIEEEPSPPFLETLSASPNPCASMVSISWSGETAEPIKVSDISGRTIAELETSLGSESTSWDASEAPSGIYLIHFENSPATAAARVVVIH